MLPVALDAFGGDNIPDVPIDGAIMAAENFSIPVHLVGDETILLEELAKRKYPKDLISIKHAPEVVEMQESVTAALRTKKRSSIKIAFDLHRSGESIGVVSAGNSGVVMAHALFTLKTFPGITRPSIAIAMPSREGYTILIDAGANVTVKPEQFVEFAVMGTVYAKHIMGVDDPRIGVLSNGAEQSKGNDLTRAADELLRNSPVNYIGYVEGNDIFTSKAHVVLAEGFVGNLVLKTSEGLAEYIAETLAETFSGHFTGLSQTLFKKAFSSFKEKIDYAEYGGALLMGVNGTVIIAHGRSSSMAIMNAIKLAANYAEKNVPMRLGDEISKVSKFLGKTSLKLDTPA